MQTKACRPTTLDVVLEICAHRKEKKSKKKKNIKANKTAGIQVSCGCKRMFYDLKLKNNN